MVMKCRFVDSDCVLEKPPENPTWCQVCSSFEYQSVMNRMNRANEIQVLFTLWSALPYEKGLQQEAGEKLKKLVGELMDDIEG